MKEASLLTRSAVNEVRDYVPVFRQGLGRRKEGRKDGRKEGKEGKTDGRTDRRTDGRTDKRTDGRKE